MTILQRQTYNVPGGVIRRMSAEGYLDDIAVSSASNPTTYSDARSIVFEHANWDKALIQLENTSTAGNVAYDILGRLFPYVGNTIDRQWESMETGTLNTQSNVFELIDKPVNHILIRLRRSGSGSSRNVNVAVRQVQHY